MQCPAAAINPGAARLHRCLSVQCWDSLLHSPATPLLPLLPPSHPVFPELCVFTLAMVQSSVPPTPPLPPVVPCHGPPLPPASPAFPPSPPLPLPPPSLSFCAQDDPPETELKAGLDLLGPVDDIFFDSYDIYEPTNDWQKDNCIISKVRRGAARGRGGAGHCTVRCTALGLTCC